MNIPSINVSSSSTVKVLRTKPVMITAGVGLVLIIVWLVAFFVPQGSQLGKYDSRITSLSAQQAQLEAKVAELKLTSKATPQLVALKKDYAELVPSTADVFNYFTLVSDTANKSHITVLSISPGSGLTPITGTSLSAITFTLNTTGTYDDTLYFIKAIYALPRLTVINSMTLGGGGPKTSRSSVLNETFGLTIFTSSQPAATAST
jgi:Tfp pilus assembly protein PilO